MFSELNPSKGSLLLSEPFMLDPNFERSVILLCEHDDVEGSIGLILNQRSNLTISAIIPEIHDQRFPLYVGGPVEGNALFFIHQAYDRMLSGTCIKEDLYWGGDMEKLLQLINQQKIEPQEIKFFLGYAGWNSEQLNSEIKENSWAVHNTFHPELMFLADGEDLWKQALISLGPKYAHVASFPKSPDWN